ncbi:MAG: ABC transporter ATP-binding protein [Brevibacillus sp.]|nr:ABC transporter ATP-binding protein [Brevibacillus sp.]
MLIAKNIKKIFQLKERTGWFRSKVVRQITAVDDVSLEMTPGKIVGLLGINGAGKTTTIKMLAAMIEPTAGILQINGIDAIRYPMEVKKYLNVITGGERNIYWRLTAKENLEYFAALYHLKPSEINYYIEKSLSLVGLTEVVDVPVERYSKGMKQRLQIARGLVNDPMFLFLDEPTLGLDVVIAKELRQHIYRLAKNENKGVLLTTHYITEVEELCDYVYVMDKGRIIAQGSPSEITRVAIPEQRITITLPSLSLEAEEALKEVAAASDVHITFDHENSHTVVHIKSKDNLIMKFIKIVTENNIPVLNVSILEPRLEDALLQLATISKEGGEVD